VKYNKPHTARQAQLPDHAIPGSNVRLIREESLTNVWILVMECPHPIFVMAEFALCWWCPQITCLFAEDQRGASFISDSWLLPRAQARHARRAIWLVRPAMGRGAQRG